MIPVTLSWQHQEYDPGYSGSCSLLTVAGVDGCSCAVVTVTGAVVALRAWDFSAFAGDAGAAAAGLEWIAGAEPIFRMDYARRENILSAPQFNLVPRRFFDPNQLPVYFNLMLREGTYAYAASELPEEGLWAVYALDPALERACNTLFGGAPVRHLANVLIPAFTGQADARHPAVFVHLRANQAYIGVVERRNLMYFHCFSWTEAADLLYYVLLAFNQFRLDPESTLLVLSGQLEPEGAAYAELRRYIRELRFAGLPPGFRMPSGLEGDAGHFLFDLFTLVAGATSHTSR